MPGIGQRQDGWPNRDLNVGAIIALSPVLPADKKTVSNSWGPGRYDPRFNIDGISTPLVLPPAYGLAGVKNETYTAEGPLSYWNAYVAVTQMHGRGNFADSRLGLAIRHSHDLVGPKFAALGAYQYSIPTPPPPAGSFDSAGAARGRAVFDGSCASCHIGTSGTDNNNGVLHAPAETGMNGEYAARTASKAYRTHRFAPCGSILPISRWKRQDARGRRGALRPCPGAQADESAETGPGRIPEVSGVSSSFG
jgi:hypothetical protein